MKLQDIKSNPNVLAIGESGKGKTQLIASFCELAPTLVLTADRRGLDTLRKYRGIEPDIELAEDWADPWSLYDVVNSQAKTHQILALDDLGALQDVIGRSIQGHSRGRDEERQRSDQRERAIRGQLMSGGRRLQQSQWGELDIAINSFLGEVMALPYRLCIVTVLEDVREHPRTGAAQVYPNLAGAIRDDLMARFSLVVNLFTEKQGEEVLYVMSCRPHPRLPNKTRYGEPRTWVNPVAARLMRHINGAETKEDQETPLERQIGSGMLREARL